jgi:hypothetical protein
MPKKRGIGFSKIRREVKPCSCSIGIIMFCRGTMLYHMTASHDRKIRRKKPSPEEDPE